MKSRVALCFLSSWPSLAPVNTHAPLTTPLPQTLNDQASVGEQGEGGLDSCGSVEAVCSELEWELIGLGTGGGAPHPDMPGLYRSHCLSSRPASPLEAFIQSQADKEVETCFLVFCDDEGCLTRKEVIRTLLDSVLAQSQRGNLLLQLALGDRKVLRPRERPSIRTFISRCS